MKLNETLETYLSRASMPMRNQIEKSIEVVRKAEKLALMYSEDGFWVGFSGGKDSQALLAIVQLAGVKYQAYFSPTSIDPPEVIRFIRQQYPEVTFTKLTKSVYSRALERQTLPTKQMRWCCKDFKERGGEGRVTLVGVRKAESVNRSKRNVIEVSHHKFSGDFSDFKQWSDEQRAAKMTQFDQFSEHKEQMVTCVGGKDKIIISPILEWSDTDVWTFLNNVLQIPHCELYDKGRTRIGCIMCPMSTHKQIVKDMIDFPQVYEKWVKTVMKLRSKEFSMTRKNQQQLYRRFNEPFYGVKGEYFDGNREREVAEAIVDWWISKLSYQTWLTRRIKQQMINFKDDGKDC